MLFLSRRQTPWLAFRRQQCQRAVSRLLNVNQLLQQPCFGQFHFNFPCSFSLCDASWLLLLWNVIHQSTVILWNIYLFRLGVSTHTVWSRVWNWLIKCQLLNSALTSSTDTVQPQWDVWNAKCLSLRCSGGHDAASVQQPLSLSTQSAD